MKRAVVFAVGALAIASCTVGSVELGGKQCPCVDGFVCDTASNTCVTTLPPDPAADAGDDQGPLPPPPPPGGRILVTNLKADWSTTNQVHWTWTAKGDPADFASYEIRTGPSAASIDDPSVVGGRRWTKDTLPELGVFAARHSQDTSPVGLSAITFAHPTNSTVFARVFAIDTAGNSTETELVSVKTGAYTPGATPIVVFHDFIPTGETLTPSTLARTTDKPFNSTAACLATPIACAGGAASCSSTIGVENANDDLSAVVFDNAFLEFAVSGEPFVDDRTYVDALFQIGDSKCATTDCRFRFPGLSLRPDGSYRLYQLPLRTFVKSDGTPLDTVQLAQQGKKLFSVYLQGPWKAGTTFRLDEVRVRW